MVFTPATMNYEPGWPLQPDKCNCDLEFIEWVNSKSGDFNIFHMGTGLHHSVGLELAGTHDVIGLTYSPAELMAYTELCQKEPGLATAYTVLFGDIAHINWSILPTFNIITVFHYGEILVGEEGISSVWNWRISYLLEHTLPRKLEPRGGRILAYMDSVAFRMVQPLFEKYLTPVGDYKSLLIYQPK